MNDARLWLPVIEKLEEADPRQGSSRTDLFPAVRKYLSPDLRVAVTIAHTYGWRTLSEVLTLERRQLDLKAGSLRLEPGTTKNDDARIVTLTAELRSSPTSSIASGRWSVRRGGSSRTSSRI